MQMCHVNSPWFILAYLGPSTKTFYTLRGRETESTKSKMFPLISNAQKVNFSIKNGIGKLWLFCFFTTRIVLLRNWTSFCVQYLQVTVQYIGPRNQTYVLYCTSKSLHIIQPWQAQFLCRDSAETDKSMTISCSIVRMKGGGTLLLGPGKQEKNLYYF